MENKKDLSKIDWDKLIKGVSELYDPKYNTTEHRGYDFVCTCHACPEQYDIYKGSYKNGNQVAYVRKRWGHLAVHPVINGKVDYDRTIYSESDNDKWNGTIDDRDYTFNKIVDAINAKLNFIK